jgi:hypothetical protein
MPKIISTKVSIRPTFALDKTGKYLANTAYFFPAGTSASYLLGFLNSNLFFAYAKRVFVEKQNDWYEVQPEGLENFPIPAVERAEHDAVAELVERVLAAKRADPQANVAALEQEIDAHVYRLYGLTKDEIKLVEESVQR